MLAAIVAALVGALATFALHAHPLRDAALAALTLARWEGRIEGALYASLLWLGIWLLFGKRG